jgi:hypothetical protein
MYKPDEPGFFIIPCFSVRSAMDIIFQTNQSYEWWPSAALSIPTNLGDP